MPPAFASNGQEQQIQAVLPAPVVVDSPPRRDMEAQVVAQAPSSLPPPMPTVSGLICPLCHEQLEDPVLAVDGHTYCRRCIQDWFQQTQPGSKPKSPATGQPLLSLLLFPNLALSKALASIRNNMQPAWVQAEQDRQALRMELDNKTRELVQAKANANSRDYSKDLNDAELQIAGLTVKLHLSEEETRHSSGLPDAGLPEAFFDHYERWHSAYQRDSLARSRELLHGIYEYKLLPHLDEILQRCPVPVLEIMMDSVLASSVDYSLEDGQGLFELASRLASALENQGLKEVAELRQRWAEDTVYTYPFLFGAETNSCHGSHLKIFVYDVPDNLTSRPLECALGQWGTEVLFHRYLLSSSCRVDDPSDADFFYVPVYGTCLFTKAAWFLAGGSYLAGSHMPGESG
ncbi:unnamed protein product [Effrenium voratum]|nr:unnamed protein product [Effrenium voratum]